MQLSNVSHNNKSKEFRIICNYLFFDHSELLFHGLEVESEESGPIEEILEVPERDFADSFVERGHERSHRTIRKVQNLGRARGIIQIWRRSRDQEIAAVTVVVIVVVVGRASVGRTRQG